MREWVVEQSNQNEPTQVVVFPSFPSPSHRSSQDASQSHIQYMLQLMTRFVEVLPPFLLCAMFEHTCNSCGKISHAIVWKLHWHVSEVLDHWKWGGCLKTCTSSHDDQHMRL